MDAVIEKEIMGGHTPIIYSSCYERNYYILTHHKYNLQDILEEVRVNGVINRLEDPVSSPFEAFSVFSDWFIPDFFFLISSIRPFLSCLRSV